MGAVTFTVTLRTDGSGAYRRLRRLLKTALRRDRLKAIDVHEHTARVSRCSTAQTVRTMTTHSRQAIGATQMSLGKRKGSDFMPVFKYDATPARSTSRTASSPRTAGATSRPTLAMICVQDT
jgi:hypothetical protein